jgi:DNA-directed RNA polymerase specialized sigma24 family protein
MQIKAPPDRASIMSEIASQEHAMSEFGRLLASETPALRRYARKLTHDKVETDDLVQIRSVISIDR